MFRLIIVSLFLLMSIEAFAENVRFGPRGESLSTLRVTSLVSEENEDKHAFLARAGRFFHNYTTNNGYEACAAICRTENSNRWGMAITTNESHIGCLIVGICPNGTPVKTNEGIHSHPVVGSFEVNRADQVFNKLRGRDVRRQSTSRVYKSTGFSDVDRAVGPGYLVEDETLLYFDGKQEIVVGPLADRVLLQDPR